MNNLNEVTSVLLQESRYKADKILEEAREKANSIIEAANEKGLKKKPEIMKSYHKKANVNLEYATLKNNMDKHKAILMARQELIDKTISRVRDMFETQTVAEWIKCIGMLIEEGKKETDEVLEILVPASYFSEVQQVFKGEYIVKASKIKSGFILSYSKFDLNYEVEHFFNYQQEELELAAFEQLFGGDKNE